MQSNFHAALVHVLKYEGGYSDHPADPGGATNLGITIGVLAEHLGRSVSKQEVRELTKSKAAEIYRRRYWEAASCGRLPDGLDLAVFDCAVNQGVGRATRFLQIAARVKADGVIGKVTLDAVARADTKTLLNEFMARRMQSYGRLHTLFRTFGLGWSRRLMATHTSALEMLDPQSRITPSPINTPPAKRFSMDYIFKRLKEPSTYAGIAAFLASIGLLGLSEQDWNQIFGAIAAVAAALAIVVREKPDAKQPGESAKTDDPAV